ncbi:MAG: 30S ribosomal protein S20 [Alphaproteobacteria bacterium]|nr:30S ribosomal protein S20 [Alphaproteobacteria bacterium]
MANTKNAQKAARKAVKRTLINKSRLSRIRSFVRQVEDAIKSGDSDAALAALKAAEPELMRGASKGVIHKNAAARKVSRLTRRAKAVGTKAAAAK